MFVRRVPTVTSFSVLNHDERDSRLDPRAPVGEIAFQRLMGISVKNKNGHLAAKVRSFGALSDLENIESPEGERASVEEEHPEINNFHKRVQSRVELMLLALWEKCAQKDLFRYDVTKYGTKTLPGSHGFLLQLNEGRITKKRPTEFRVDKVVQEFDATKFNFTKARMQEVLFLFDTKASSDLAIVGDALAGKSPDLVMINVCPIEYGHILLVPRVLDRLAQLVNPSAMSLALQFASAVGNPYFRLNFNSFGAFASINHLHFQGYFLMAPFPCELVPTVPIEDTLFDSDYVRVSELIGYPVRGWVFEMSAAFDHSLEPMAEAVGHVCMKLQEMDIPHNMVIVDCGARVILWPQCFLQKLANGEIPQELLETQIYPAVSEIAGHVIVKRAKDFEEFDQEKVWKLLSEASLPADRFAALTKACMKALI